MSDDIVSRLRNCNCIPHCLCADAADEIERLRKELGQVSDADSWVSESDAAHLDSLLNWCEFNAMDWHRALARLVNDRARLRGEVNRLREVIEAWLQYSRRAERDIETLRAERDEARRDRCMARAVIRWDLEHPNSPQRTETTIILLAWQIADEEGWDCFEGMKR